MLLTSWRGCALHAELTDEKTLFAIDLNVTVTWTGTFTAKGYVAGRLSAALYRCLPAAPGFPAMQQLGFAPNASAELCTLTSMGRFVIRYVNSVVLVEGGARVVDCS